MYNIGSADKLIKSANSDDDYFDKDKESDKESDYEKL